MPVGAPEDGTVSEIKVAEGDTVEGNQVIAILEEA
jgi:pyruvate/2-oxoglutarate dehydrogenase complex dihydrolipoamide acyltransferase (E2) component